MADKFIVPIPKYITDCPNYFINFLQHCLTIARKNDWSIDTVMNYQLKPLGGRIIFTKTQGPYFRWDTESAFTMFVLKWE